ncbi:hypothetical protein ACUV84_040901 [Puccinellia chinampoensis]
MEGINYNIVVWNVRGLNSPNRWTAVRVLIEDANAAVVCLVETKLENVTPFSLNQILGSRYDGFTFLPASGTAGGIIVAWQSNLVTISLPRVDTFSVTLYVDFVNGNKWWHTIVYGPTEDAERPSFLEELREVRAICNGLWTVAGDFNLILNAEDKNNSRLNRRIMGRFRRLVSDLELTEAPLIGRKYTWSNERDIPTLSRIDRWFCSSDWDADHPNCLLQALSSSLSDHCALQMSTNVNFSQKCRFHFESFWPKLPGFQELVADAWATPVDASDHMQTLHLKLKATTRALTSWGQRKVGNIREQLLLAQEIVLRLDMAQDSRTLTWGETWLRKELKRKILGLASLQRTMARQRSRLLWIKEGDANTTFFHAHASKCRRRNHMFKLKKGDREVTDQQEMEELATEFFTDLIGQPKERVEEINLDALGLSRLNLDDLEANFTEEEIWSVVKNLPADKSPGPDGFSVLFFQKCWATIKVDFMAAIT